MGLHSSQSSVENPPHPAALSMSSRGRIPGPAVAPAFLAPPQHAIGLQPVHGLCSEESKAQAGAYEIPGAAFSTGAMGVSRALNLPRLHGHQSLICFQKSRAPPTDTGPWQLQVRLEAVKTQPVSASCLPPALQAFEGLPVCHKRRHAPPGAH